MKYSFNTGKQQQQNNSAQPQVVKVYPSGQVVTTSHTALSSTSTTSNGQQVINVVKPGIFPGSIRPYKINS